MVAAEDPIDLLADATGATAATAARPLVRVDPPVQPCVAPLGCGVYCTPTVVVSRFKNVFRIGRIRRPDGGTARCNALGAPAQRFLSTHAAYYAFEVQRYLTSAQLHRALGTATMSTWRKAVRALAA